MVARAKAAINVTWYFFLFVAVFVASASARTDGIDINAPPSSSSPSLIIGTSKPCDSAPAGPGRKVFTIEFADYEF